MKGRRAGIAGAAVAAGLAGAVVAAPAPGAASAQATGLAGYGASALSSAVQFQLNSPGQLPIGDATTGNVVEVDLSYARSHVSSGPTVDALGSPLYPGDAAANAGSAIQQFGGPPTPNDPVVAHAEYPPTPSNGGNESFAGPLSDSPDASLDLASSRSHAGPDGATVTTDGGTVAIGPAAGTSPHLVTMVSSAVANDVKPESGSITATATSRVSGITVAGVIDIAGVNGSARGTSDGTSGTPSASLGIGRVTVGGQTAFIDQDGIHLAGPPQGGPTVSNANLILQNLAAQGVSVRVLTPTETATGSHAGADSGAVEISFSTRTPDIPGSPPQSGLPPLPGQQSVPVTVNVLLGNAAVGADATAAPSFETPGGSAGSGTGPAPAPLPSSLPGASVQSAGPGNLTGPAGVTGAAGAGSYQPAEPAPENAPSGPTAGQGPAGPGTRPGAVTGPGSSLQAALAAAGRPVPVGLTVGWLLLAVMAGAGLLAAARWQLIRGSAQ